PLRFGDLRRLVGRRSRVLQRGRAKEVGAEPFLPGNGMRRAAPGGAPVERWPPSLHIDYGPDIESALSQLSDAVRQGPDGEVGETPRWLGLKLLEGERESVARVGPARNDLLIMAREATQRLAEAHPEGLPLVIADRRYQFIHQLGQLILRRPSTQRPTLTDRVDAIVTHTWLGLPLFLVVMYLVFGLVVGVSRPLVDWIGATISGPIAHWVYELADWLHAPSWLSSLAGEGIIGGVGGVLVFVPVLGLLFLFISVLEDSGYMARAAFLMNRLMSFVGLHGKSFVPLILGFGCGVPAIYATRTLESRRDRTLTALLVPMMSCSARLPVYMVFVLAFFTGRAQLVIWALYALGVTVAIAGGMVFSRILFRSVRKAPFLMELPPYRLPRARNLWRAVSTRLHHFLRQASTVILSVSVLVWVLTHLPWGVNSLEASWFGNLSARLAPAFRPAGFGTWQAAGSLVTGFVAKELVVSTMTQIYLADGGSAPHASQPNVLAELRSIAQGLFVALGEAGKETLELLTPGWKLFPSQGGGQDPALVGTLRQTFTPASALAFVVFVLVYVPCAATLAAIRHEFGARWAAFSAAYQTILAWVLAVAVYHGARWIGIG
ncbi:MAG TPA: ferrous iron transport protein B, partial [Anaerolineales bacterium]|nr:ferrous iron transport protein B [Anaerolineales bacterium]